MKFRDQKRCVITSIIATLIGCMICIWMVMKLVSLPPPSSSNFNESSKDLSIETVATWTPSHESNISLELTSFSRIVDDSIRNCLGDACQDHRYRDGDRTIQRIGILAFPLSGGDFVSDFLNYYTNSSLSNIEIIFDTHVPTYGYGKNHGWSRIIRLYRNILAISEDICEDNAGGLKNSSDSLYGDQVKQILRWNCRLNHVAAHTKMLSIFMDDFSFRPFVELEKMVSFIGIKVNRADLKIAWERFLLKNKDRVPSFLGNRHDADLLFRMPFESQESCLRAIKEEWIATQGMSQWPCQLFRNLSPRLHISPEFLAPNCSNPKVRCTISYDRQGG